MRIIIFDKIYKALKNDSEVIIKLVKTFLTRGLSAVGTFVFHLVLVRVMGVKEYGIFITAYTLIMGVSLLAKFGMTSAILRFSSIMFKNKEFGKILKLKRDITYLNFSICFFFSLLICFNVELISTYFFKKQDVTLLLYLFSACLPFYSYLTIQSSFLKSFSKPEIAPLFEIGFMVFFTAGFIFIYSLFFDYVSSIQGAVFLLVSCFIIYLTGSYVLNKVILNQTSGVHYKDEEYKGFYPTLISFGIATLSNYFLKFSPILILGYYHTSKEVAYYSIANNTAFLINFVLWIISSVYAPYFANLYNENKIKELNKLLNTSIIYMLTVALPLFLLIIIFPAEIISLFDSNYGGSPLPLIILAIAQLINVSTGPILFLMNMIGREKELMIVIVWTSVLSVALGFILIPVYSYIGAAIATAIGLILQNLTTFYKAKTFMSNIENK